jgi:hypothetical protein
MTLVGTFVSFVNADGTIDIVLQPIDDPPVDPIRDFVLMSQRDPRWRYVKLGYGNTTIGSYGCVITSLAMALTHAYGREITPEEVNNRLKDVGGYTGSNKNLVIWKKVTEAFPEFKYRTAGHYVTIAAPVERIDAALDRGDYVLIRVDSNLNTTGIDHHWTLITGGNSDKYTIGDPWPLPDNQMPLTIPSAYTKPGWTPARAIFSVVIFSKEE